MDKAEGERIIFYEVMRILYWQPGPSVAKTKSPVFATDGPGCQYRRSEGALPADRWRDVLNDGGKQVNVVVHTEGVGDREQQGVGLADSNVPG